MKLIATTLGTLTLAVSLAGSGLAQSRVSSKRPLTHHRVHHVRHMHTGIGPGGDQDGDNHGAPSDGDGNF
jgi:hypothetical protein